MSTPDIKLSYQLVLVGKASKGAASVGEYNRVI